MAQHGKYPDTFYRVSVKAVIKNPEGKVLCVKEDASDIWELPGGGIDHSENVRAALARELAEEISYTDDFSYTLADILTMYDPSKERALLFISADVTLTNEYTPQTSTDTTAVEWLDPTQFKTSDARAEQAIYRAAVDPTFPVAFTRSAKK